MTITGPTTAFLGVPTAFNANATDNAGGVGIDPNGFQWTGAGLTPTNAATATYTFGARGTSTIGATARDARGNVSEPATLSVIVTQSTFGFPAKAPAKAKKSKKSVTVKVKGVLTPVAGLPADKACTGKVTLRVRKGKKQLGSKTVSLTSACGFAKTIKIKRKKVGKAKKLKLQLVFTGNSFVKAGSKAYTLKVKK